MKIPIEEAGLWSWATGSNTHSNISHDQQPVDDHRPPPTEMKTPKSEPAPKTSSKAQFRKYSAGPVTRNPFLNFMRDFRRSNAGETMCALTSEGARIWRDMTKEAREQYRTMAHRAPRKERRRRRRRGRHGRR